MGTGARPSMSSDCCFGGMVDLAEAGLPKTPARAALDLNRLRSETDAGSSLGPPPVPVQFQADMDPPPTRYSFIYTVIYFACDMSAHYYFNDFCLTLLLLCQLQVIPANFCLFRPVSLTVDRSVNCLNCFPAGLQSRALRKGSSLQLRACKTALLCPAEGPCQRRAD